MIQKKDVGITDSDYCGFCGQDFERSALGMTVWSGEQVGVGMGDR